MTVSYRASTWAEPGDPPGFGPYGARSPMESAEHPVERFHLGPVRPGLPPSPALSFLLSAPVDWYPAFLDARHWVSAQLASGWPQAAPDPDPTPPDESGDRARRRSRMGVLGVGAGLGLMAAGAAALPVMAAGAAYGYRWYRRRGEPAAVAEADPGASRVELRRLRHGRRWVRDAEIQVLPPGASSQYTRTTTVGLSRSIAVELGATLGLGHDSKIVKLNAELSRTLNQSFSITDQQEETFSVTIENNRADVDRYYAMWRVEDRVSVDQLVLSGHTLHWRPETEATFYRTPTISYTMTQVRRRDH